MTIHLEWTKDFSVGDEIIDAQHQKLLMQINKIIDAIVFGVEVKNVQENMIPFLDQYIKEHFLYEEEYMNKMNYSDLEKHKKEHRNFIKNYIKFKAEFENGGDRGKLILKIEKFLDTWWLKHIGGDDQKYRKFFEENKNSILQ